MSPGPERRQGRAWHLFVGAAMVLLLGLLVLGGLRKASEWGMIRNSREQPLPPRRLPPSPPLPGEPILASYASPASRPQDDLSLMAHAFSNLLILVKGDAPFRMGANEEFAAALRGRNHDQLRFLPDDHPCFNAQGQVVDRWGSPLFFHVTSRDRIDIRSAGPDRQMWTDDDLERRHDGQFRKGKSPP